MKVTWQLQLKGLREVVHTRWMACRLSEKDVMVPAFWEPVRQSGEGNMLLCAQGGCAEPPEKSVAKSLQPLGKPGACACACSEGPESNVSCRQSHSLAACPLCLLWTAENQGLGPFCFAACCISPQQAFVLAWHLSGSVSEWNSGWQLARESGSRASLRRSWDPDSRPHIVSGFQLAMNVICRPNCLDRCTFLSVSFGSHLRFIAPHADGPGHTAMWPSGLSCGPSHSGICEDPGPDKAGVLLQSAVTLNPAFVPCLLAAALQGIESPVPAVLELELDCAGSSSPPSLCPWQLGTAQGRSKLPWPL